MNNLRFILISMLLIILAACKTDVTWEVEDITVNMSVETVSAGFVECHFSTNKDAYYFISCEPIDTTYDPTAYPKQFMTLALDSAYAEYLMWRSYELRMGEFNVAPFASHVLQYGNVEHFFTQLRPDTDYWVYAFVVNPDNLKPYGKLYLQTVHTAKQSTVPIKFEYRVKGYWDYLYPVDENGHINSRYPYVATTRDSLEIAYEQKTPEDYFNPWLEDMVAYAYEDIIYFGVHAICNDSYHRSYLTFMPDHTYYTILAALDGGVGKRVIYKFHWTGEDTNIYLREDDAYAVETGTMLSPVR
ncbi:MAG: hypothetical protein K5660_07995 [Paludibacteraceae bacterium]|nr:hypothetical protein [Paludibacteraceae bacterium]